MAYGGVISKIMKHTHNELQRYRIGAPSVTKRLTKKVLMCSYRSMCMRLMVQPGFITHEASATPGRHAPRPSMRQCHPWCPAASTSNIDPRTSQIRPLGCRSFLSTKMIPSTRSTLMFGDRITYVYSITRQSSQVQHYRLKATCVFASVSMG